MSNGSDLYSKFGKYNLRFLEDKDKATNLREGLTAADKAGLAAEGASLVGQQIGGDAGGVIGGAGEYAAMGAKFGGVKGAIVGGVIGGVMGGLGARSERKAAAAAAKAKAEAEHATNLGRIEEEKDAKIQGAFSRLSQAFASNLRRKKKVTL